MKGLIVFGSTRGNTRTVAGRVPGMLEIAVDVMDVKNIGSTELLAAYDILVFFASTWGDGELQADMEDFLARHPLQLGGKPYAICELGNYYGYDDFEYGAMRIMRHYLEQGGGTEFVEPFSMDSMPRKDWDGLERWCKLLNARMKV